MAGSPSIEQIVAQIRTAIYGKDVRENIALGIEKSYSDISTAKTIADDSAAAANTAAATANTAAATANTAANRINSLITVSQIGQSNNYKMVVNHV